MSGALPGNYFKGTVFFLHKGSLYTRETVAIKSSSLPIGCRPRGMGVLPTAREDAVYGALTANPETTLYDGKKRVLRPQIQRFLKIC